MPMIAFPKGAPTAEYTTGEADAYRAGLEAAAKLCDREADRAFDPDVGDCALILAEKIRNLGPLVLPPVRIPVGSHDAAAARAEADALRSGSRLPGGSGS